MSTPNSAATILTNELTRLQTKKASIDDAYNTQKRLMILNDSYRKRYSRYTQMMAIFVLCIIGVLVLNIISKSFPFIPSIVMSALTLILLVYCIYKIIVIYFEILSRSPINYDELNLPPTVDSTNNTPAMVDVKDETSQIDFSKIYAMLQASGISACIGKDCCAEGQKYNEGQQRCEDIGPFTQLFDVRDMAQGDRGSVDVFAQELGTPIVSPVSTTGERFVEQRFLYKS